MNLAAMNVTSLLRTSGHGEFAEELAILREDAVWCFDFRILSKFDFV